MRRFINTILLFLLPLFLISLFLEIALRRIPNDYSYKKKYLDEHAHEIETLVLGSSHAFRGLNPQYLGNNAFNASMVSQSLDYDYRIFMKYEKEFENLKTIVLPISYFTLFGKLENGVEAWRTKSYVIYYGFNSSGDITDYFEILSNKVNVNVKRLRSFYIQNKSNISCSELGWGKQSKSSESIEETGKSAAKRHTRENIHSDKIVKVFNENVLILNSMLKYCREKNIRVFLFTPPAYSTYRENLNTEQWNVTLETATALSKDYSNCSYVNLLADTSFVAEDFYDADHMNETGAKKLSLIIEHYINSHHQ